MSDSLRVLIVEDLEDDALLIVRELRRGDFEVTWKRIQTAAEMQEALGESSWDAIISDYKLPHFSAPVAFKLARESELDIPFVVVSGAIGEEVAVEMMKAGAHDYIMKGNLSRLSEAVRRELREAHVRRERKQAETAFRESEQRYRTLIQSMSEGLIQSDSNGVIQFVNDRLCEMLGYSREFLTGKTLDELFVQNKDKEFIRERIRLRTNKISDRYEMELNAKSGQTLWVQCGDVPLEGAEGEVIGSIRVVTDISERKRAEEQQRFLNEQLRDLLKRLDSVREEVSKKIAREVHDELGQTLTGLKMGISSLSKKLPKDSEVLREEAADISRLVDSTLHSVHKISTELRPGILDDLGLVPAIEWQAAEFQKRAGIPCTLSLPLERITVGSDRSMTIFRILQESLTNVARHSRATAVSISLSVDSGNIILNVTDNGKGITEKEMSDPKSLGLAGMRERAQVINGKLEITETPAGGTSVSLTVPNKDVLH